MSVPAERVSLVDTTEEALRTWLATGGHRGGDRLPPELELAGMLGVSRGTLRTALERLEETGEIVRRQGSGTFVGRVATPSAFSEGLETLVAYSALAERRGVRLAVRDVLVTTAPVAADVAEAFGVEPGREAITASRLVLADGEPAAIMRDVIHPDVEVGGGEALRGTLLRGGMVLDYLLEAGVAVGFARTRVTALLLTPEDPAGAAFGVTGPTAGLELEEVMYLTSGEAVQWSRDVFAPGGLDLHVHRALDGSTPQPITGARTAR